MTATLVKKSNNPNICIDPRSKNKKIVPSTAKFRLYLTITMGIFIPLFSLSLSHVGGTLLAHDGNYIVKALAAMSLTLMACVLSVSLSHLAWAVQNITKSPQWASWLLAVSFDLALVLGELCHVSANEAGVGFVVSLIMAAVCLLSMFLNCWAFLLHPGEVKKAKKKK